MLSLQVNAPGDRVFKPVAGLQQQVDGLGVGHMAKLGMDDKVEALQQLLVVEGDAQLIRQLFADFAAAAAELPPDGDNGAIMHKKPVLSPGSLPFLASSILRFSRFVYRFIKKFTKKSIKQAPLLCKDNSGA